MLPAGQPASLPACMHAWGGAPPQALLQARATEGCGAGAVGLVKAGLEDQQQAQTVRHRLDVFGQPQRMLLRLNDVGAGHDEERLCNLESLVELRLLRAAGLCAPTVLASLNKHSVRSSVRTCMALQPPSHQQMQHDTDRDRGQSRASKGQPPEGSTLPFPGT